ncbi:MAG TPA: right-handed parallel beta-helix repeat-containing protein, partial [bacterium]|nr:right-handed parallel beta-helix repeat-containing protein [bacterium]
GTTDSAVIRSRLNLPGYAAYTDSFLFVPFRVGPVDTTVGGDSIAPRAPDTVAVRGSTGQCTVTWKPSTVNEDIGTAATDLAGYRIYRSRTADTNVWQLVGSVGAATLTYADAPPAQDEYFYRVTAFDNAETMNESFYSDSRTLGSAVADTTGPNCWYVNDTQTAGDVYCSAAGSNSNSGRLPNKPLLSLREVYRQMSAGDTVYIDAGMYFDSFVVTADTIWFIGAGTDTTKLRPPKNQVGITATNRRGFVLRDFSIDTVGGSGINGMTLTNCRNVELTRCAVNYAMQRCLDLQNDTDVRISGCRFGRNLSSYGVVQIERCDRVVVSNCVMDSTASSAGLQIYYSTNCEAHGCTVAFVMFSDVTNLTLAGLQPRTTGYTPGGPYVASWGSNNDSVSVTGCRLGNFGYAADIQNSKRVTMYNNRFDSCSYAIDARYAYQMTVDSNTFTRSGGIRCNYHYDTLTISNNLFKQLFYISINIRI